MVKIRGEDTATAMREWIKKEIVRGPTQSHELGTFFLGVSTSTVGLFTGIVKLSKTQLISNLLVASFGILAVSMLLALWMVIPRIHDLVGDEDLMDKYRRRIERIRVLSWAWFGIWVIGFGVGAWAILS
jgi:hypothetical protein